VNLLALIPGVLKTLGGVLGIGDKVKAVTDAIESAQGSPELRAQLEQSLRAHEEEMQRLSIEELKAIMSESMAMIASPDKFVSRARPTGLYFFYGVSTAIAVGMLFGIKIDPTAILTIIGPLAGVGGTYVVQRTREKLKGNGNE